ncbi:MAG: Zn-ribbon domain-containing OB-fold protein [Acidimicrobiales bacterium]
MIAPGPSLRLLPRLDQENRFFWTSGADGRLRFLRCAGCRQFVHPPAPLCPFCLGGTLSPEPVSGRAVVESFTVNHQQWIPGSHPYIVAWVSIVEQPDVRLTTNLVGIEPDDVHIGMESTVEFAHHDDVYLPLFRPVTAPS